MTAAQPSPNQVASTPRTISPRRGPPATTTMNAGLGILGVSATYEFTEWWAALAGGDAAGAFLGTQGDVWDTQWDMFLCLIGATLSLLLWSRLHDRQLGPRA